MSTPEEVEPLILGLIKEYLKKKPFFSIEDIVEYISHRTRAKPYLNKNKIEKNIKDLKTSAIIILVVTIIRFPLFRVERVHTYVTLPSMWKVVSKIQILDFQVTMEQPYCFLNL